MEKWAFDRSKLPYRDRVEVLAFDKDGRVYAGQFGDGSFGFIGGGTDGEDAVEAAKREFKEEVGHALSKVKLIDVPPVSVEWETEPKSEKMRRRMKRFRGTRTYFVYAEVIPGSLSKPEDADAPMTRLGFHPCGMVREHLRGGASPEQSDRRRAALDACLQKTAEAFTDRVVILGKEAAWPRPSTRRYMRDEIRDGEINYSPVFEPLEEWRGNRVVKHATLTFTGSGPGQAMQKAVRGGGIPQSELLAKARAMPGYGSVSPQPAPPQPAPTGPALRGSTPAMQQGLAAAGRKPQVSSQELLQKIRARRPRTETMVAMDYQMPRGQIPALTKNARVNELIQTTPMEPEPDGKDVHVRLDRNPYLDPLQPPDSAPEYENGYQYAQQLGHVALGQVSQEDIESWSGRPAPWREGFAEGARRLGVGRVADMLTGGQGDKMATWNWKSAEAATIAPSAAPAASKKPPVFAMNPMSGSMTHVSGGNVHGTRDLAKKQPKNRTSNVYGVEKGQLKLQSWEWGKEANILRRGQIGGLAGAALPIAAGAGLGMMGGEGMADLLPGSFGDFALPAGGAMAGGAAATPLAIPGAAMGTAMGLRSGIRSSLRNRPTPTDAGSQEPSPAMPALQATPQALPQQY